MKHIYKTVIPSFLALLTYLSPTFAQNQEQLQEIKTLQTYIQSERPHEYTTIDNITLKQMESFNWLATTQMRDDLTIKTITQNNPNLYPIHKKILKQAKTKKYDPTITLDIQKLTHTTLDLAMNYSENYHALYTIIINKKERELLCTNEKNETTKKATKIINQIRRNEKIIHIKEPKFISPMRYAFNTKIGAAIKFYDLRSKSPSEEIIITTKDQRIVEPIISLKVYSRLEQIVHDKKKAMQQTKYLLDKSSQGLDYNNDGIISLEDIKEMLQPLHKRKIRKGKKITKEEIESTLTICTITLN